MAQFDKSGFNAAGGGVNALAPGVSHASGWLMELLLTAVLVFVVLAATDTVRETVTAHLPVLAPFAIGFTVFICHLVAIPIDGCSINRELSNDSACCSLHSPQITASLPHFVICHLAILHPSTALPSRPANVYDHLEFKLLFG